MVFIEIIVKGVYMLLQEIIWLFTARDCRHCKRSYSMHNGEVWHCKGGSDCEKECERSLFRKHFERGRWLF